MSRIISLLLFVFFAIFSSSGCTSNAPKPEKPGTTGQSQGEGVAMSTIDPDLIPAETLAKRVVLYKLAMQEGDLAPFTVKPEDAAKGNYPAIVKQFNPAWWKIQWGTTSLKPLPYSEMTMLESTVFPLIASKMEQDEKASGWVLFTLGYDPNTLRQYIANAHKNWLPEERDIYLKGTEPDCLQVWGAKVNGEWKILAQITCLEDVARPTPPKSPDVPMPAPEPPTSTAQN
jgi:hypothetical protein